MQGQALPLSLGHLPFKKYLTWELISSILYLECTHPSIVSDHDINTESSQDYVRKKWKKPVQVLTILPG